MDRVAALLHQVAAEAVLPRFRQLRAEDVIGKPTPGDPEDIVTAVDREVERRLELELAALAPGVAVLGEESAHERPELLRLLDADDPLWIVDPIDGTKNFAAGDDGFGVMLAFVSQGLARAAWILLPARGELYTAQAGAGAFRNGVAVRAPATSTRSVPRGPLKTKFMHDPLRAAIEAAARGRFQPAPLTGCSATDYPDVLAGATDFAVYHRLNAWDHAAGALILTEAGGTVEHLDGASYTPRSRHRPTVIAASPAIAAQVRGWLAPAGGGL
jgi:fructose-1,6-bisphosphatase/inositol monophosphatase family enzyme